MRRAALCGLLCAGVGALAFASTARADRAAEARFHDEAARRHYDAGRYDAAVREFMIGQRIAPNPNTLLNIAFCFRALERNEEAYMYFAEFLDADTEHPERRARAEEALQELTPRVALVRIESDPSGADIYVDRAELGRYGQTPRVLALTPGEHRVWVEREGHRPAASVVTLERGRTVTVTLEPPAIVGRLRLTASAPARVRVIGPSGVVWEGESPVDAELPAGHYEVRAVSGRDRWSEALTVPADGVASAHAELTGPTGELSVIANHPGAQIRIDGEEWGYAPQVLGRVPVGTHQLELRLDGMRPYAGEIEITEDARSWARVSLSPAPRGPFTEDTVTAGALALALLGAAGVFTAMTVQSHDQLTTSQQSGRSYLDSLDETNRFAVTADLLWLAGGAAALTTLVLVFIHVFEDTGPSTALLSDEEAP
ncbi:MAG: PEGA domain-containing protein [Myxococcota bacterium]|nr:PEGA domain-containing protein [Myxococcota bacterium]